MSFPKSSLSLHATQRVAERFRISAVELLALLNSGQGKRIGSTARSHLVHRLMWSHVDKDLLVAIQNISDGMVLTVLPLEMYRRNYQQNLTERRIQTVINMMVHAGFAPASLWKPGVPEERIMVVAEVESTTAPITVGSWRGPVESACLRRLGEKREFWAWVTEQLTARGGAVQNLVAVRAKFSGGDFEEIPFAVDAATTREAATG
jgi:hypothetical protein